ncbi:MAG: CDGSH iron-sulfur domain-containing protein [Gammaproteobacteria bacterium]|nr:CDGSH iron-sulfur domain-containing protein [Gammaproteobacteria bacterium]
MSEPVCAQKFPIKVDLEPGQYWWCSCGKSQKQPFCDGSHKGSEFSPQAIKLDEKKTLWLCACKRTKNAPACDGTHKSLT